MSDGDLVAEQTTILRFPRTGSLRPVPAAGEARQAAIARLRRLLPREAVIYAVRRAHDPSAGWIVCDFYRIDGAEAACITADVALVLECYDPAREVGVKLRRSPGADPLAPIVGGRLSTVLFGRPGALTHCMLG